jgi:serine/threonine protein kinase
MSVSRDSIARKEEARRTAQVLISLPAELRLPLELRHLEGWSLAAIAQAIQKSEAHIVCLLRYGLRLLEHPDLLQHTVSLQPVSPTPVDEILAASLSAADSGQPLDRSALLELHPQLAGDLADFFARTDRLAALIWLLEEIWPSLATSPSARDETLPHLPGQPDATVGVEVPGYEILGLLGRGGMGIVYLAFHLKLKREVALKMIRSGRRAGAAELERFRAEAEALARLQHPNIVQIFDVDQHEGQPYCALEYVPGGTLAKHLASKPQPPRWSADMTRKLALAVEAAHQASIVHRDLKPGNVLLTADGQPKVTDFGLVKYLDDEAGHSRLEGVLGTPGYMAPEQAKGKKDVGRATDVYALGAILYECLTGQPPFQGATAEETMARVCTQPPVPVRQLQPRVPRDLEVIVHKCLAKDPNQRYASAQELADRLQLFLAGEPIPERPRSWLNKAARCVWKHPLLSSAIVLAALAVTAGLLLWHYLDPELPRKEVNWALASGKPYVFKGTEALPGPFRQVYGAASLIPGGSHFSVDSHGDVLWELTSNLQSDSYEFSADVRHDDASGLSQVGIYFGLRVKEPADDPRHGGFYTLTFADCGDMDDPTMESVSFVKILPRLFEDGNPHRAAGLPIVSKRFQTDLPPAGPGPWRTLRLRVTLSEVDAVWEPIPGQVVSIGTVPAAGLSGAMRRLARSLLHVPDVPNFTDVPTDYRPRASAGLFVSRGKASFRNVTLTPRSGG